MKNKILVYLFVLLASYTCDAQDKDARNYFYNLHPAKQNTVLDSVSNTDISFAFSLRKLRKEYTGWCVQVRRSTDNALQNIGFNGDGLIDTPGLNKFVGAGQAFVVIWYDQSGLGRNAVQTTINRQPLLTKGTHKDLPTIDFDGSNDGLVVNTSMQILTNAGADGTVFYVGDMDNQADVSWGAAAGGRRWFVHTSWNNNQVYFDPGQCCNGPRSFVNTVRLDSFDQYTFRRAGTTTQIRMDNVIRMNGTYSLADYPFSGGFGIGAGYDGANTFSHSRNKFQEFIMYRVGVSAAIYNLLERNQMSFWKI